MDVNKYWKDTEIFSPVQRWFWHVTPPAYSRGRTGAGVLFPHNLVGLIFYPPTHQPQEMECAIFLPLLWHRVSFLAGSILPYFSTLNSHSLTFLASGTGFMQDSFSMSVAGMVWGWLKHNDFPGGSDGKASVYDRGDPGPIPGLGRSLGEGNGNPLQYSCLENPMDGGAQWAAVHGVSRNQTRLGDLTFTFHFHALEKEMATHSSVLAWRIPGMGEPGGLPSMGSHRVGRDWSDLGTLLLIFHWDIIDTSHWICFRGTT